MFDGFIEFFTAISSGDALLKTAAILCVCLLIVLIAGSVIAYFALKKSGRPNVIRTKDLTFGAVCLAVSFLLSFLGISLPYGGTLTVASVLPVMLYCYYFGFFKGLVVTVAYTVLQFFQSPYIVHPMSAVMDYVIPYLSIIFLGIFSYRQKRFDDTVAAGKPALAAHVPFFIGVGCYFAVRYLSHVLSGVIFYAEYIAWGGWWLNHLWAYSFAYNAAFFVPDTAIALAAAVGVLSSKAFNALMASSANTFKNTDATKEHN